MKSIKKRRALAITFAIFTGGLVASLIILRLFGLLGIYSIPVASMEPAVSKGDCILTEGISLRLHRPARGDIIAFRTDAGNPRNGIQVYLKRVIGLPGETLRITDGKLYVNDKPVVISNSAGAIDFSQKMEFPTDYLGDGSSYTVPQESYFVIGDNLTHSADSRFFGAVPFKDITAHILFRYWPPGRMGVPK